MFSTRSRPINDETTSHSTFADTQIYECMLLSPETAFTKYAFKRADESMTTMATHERTLGSSRSIKAHSKMEMKSGERHRKPMTVSTLVVCSAIMLLYMVATKAKTHGI